MKLLSLLLFVSVCAHGQGLRSHTPRASSDSSLNYVKELSGVYIASTKYYDYTIIFSDSIYTYYSVNKKRKLKHISITNRYFIVDGNIILCLNGDVKTVLILQSMSSLVDNETGIVYSSLLSSIETDMH